MTKLMLVQVLKMSESERRELSDEQIVGLDYVIRYGDYNSLSRAGGLSWETVQHRMGQLNSRLDEIEARKAAAAPPKPKPQLTQRCSHCGRKISDMEAMSASSGIVCPSCYDSASY